MELRLPELPWCARTDHRGASGDVGMYRDLRRQRALGPAQRLGRRRPSDRELRAAARSRELDGDPEDHVGFRIREASTGCELAYFSAVGALTPTVVEGLAGADCVFFDGTFWAGDELPALGLGTARAEAMAQAPIGGPDGTLVRLAGLAARRRIFVRLNNTNPLLRRDSPEHRAVEAWGSEVAEDGLEVIL